MQGVLVAVNVVCMSKSTTEFMLHSYHDSFFQDCRVMPLLELYR